MESYDEGSVFTLSLTFSLLRVRAMYWLLGRATVGLSGTGIYVVWRPAREPPADQRHLNGGGALHAARRGERSRFFVSSSGL